MKTQKFKMASPKYELLFRRMRFKVFHSGRGTGKSWALGMGAVYYMTKCKVRILSCRYHQNSIKDSNHKLISDTIERLGLQDQFTINNDSIVNNRTGSEMIFKGLYNNLSSLKSIENVGICIVDEAESVTQEAWDTLIPTIRSKNSEIWVSFNPRLTSDDTWKRFIRNQPPNCEVVRLELSDNPYISPDLIAESNHMKETDLANWEWIWGGEPRGGGIQSLVPQKLIDKARENMPIADKSLAIIAGLDVSGLGSDHTQLIRRRGQQILSIDTMKQGDTIQVTNWVKEIYNARPFDKIVIDASGSTGVYDQISEWSRATNLFKTFRFIGGSKSRKPKQYFNLRTEVHILARDWLIDGRITSHPQWDEICKLGYSFIGKDLVKLDSKKTLKKSPDLFDAFTMTFLVDDKKDAEEVELPRVFEYGNTNVWCG